ncbi:MAG: hypothetical protein AAFP76_08975 [Bacteroidota bacterium]
MTTTNKPNVWFWIIGVIALIWNILGVMAYLLRTVLLTDEAKALLPAEQVELFDNMPSWLNIVFAVAVFSGLLGCLLLLMKRKMATPLFGISLLAALVQNIYGWFGTNSAEVFGTVQGYIMPMVVITICIFLYFYSKGAAQKGWLR